MCLARRPLALQQDSLPCMMVSLYMSLSILGFLAKEGGLSFCVCVWPQGHNLRASQTFKCLEKTRITVKWEVVTLSE